MSYETGMAALNLKKPERVPRTEYSADSHWKLVKKVTGLNVDENSAPEVQKKASTAFKKAWNYDFAWSTLISRGIFGDLHTNMGHAVYAQGGTDYDDDINCPFTEPEEVLNFDPWEVYGERDQEQIVREFEEHYQQNRDNNPNAVNMTGIYVTCISGLIEIFGWDILLLAAGVDQKQFGEMTNRYASWIQQYYNALGKADVPVVMVHDDIVWTSGPFISPEWYRQYVFPNYEKYFAPLKESGKKILFTSDGNYTEFIDDLAKCGVNGFALEPTTDMEYIAENYGDTHVFIGNADTRVLLRGTKKEIRVEVERCMKLGKECPGFVMAVGNHIPSNTPVENALYYNQVYEELCQRY